MAWQMRVDPHNLQAKLLLEGGEFGRVFRARRRHCLTTSISAFSPRFFAALRMTGLRSE